MSSSPAAYTRTIRVRFLRPLPSQRITDVARDCLQTSISASGAHVLAHLCHWVSTNRGRRHMGVTVVKEERGDVDKIIAAVKESISEALAEASKKA